MIWRDLVVIRNIFFLLIFICKLKKNPIIFLSSCSFSRSFEMNVIIFTIKFTIYSLWNKNWICFFFFCSLLFLLFIYSFVHIFIIAIAFLSQFANKIASRLSNLFFCFFSSVMPFWHATVHDLLIALFLFFFFFFANDFWNVRLIEYTESLRWIMKKSSFKKLSLQILWSRRLLFPGKIFNRDPF